eukprot:Selendium_serpulae@DN6026_c0_g1_i1.p1
MVMQAYVGTEPLPTHDGQPTVNPEEFPYQKEIMATSHTAVFPDNSGNVYIVVHINVCGSDMTTTTTEEMTTEDKDMITGDMTTTTTTTEDMTTEDMRTEDMTTTTTTTEDMTTEDMTTVDMTTTPRSTPRSTPAPTPPTTTEGITFPRTAPPFPTPPPVTTRTPVPSPTPTTTIPFSTSSEDRVLFVGFARDSTRSSCFKIPDFPAGWSNGPYERDLRAFVDLIANTEQCFFEADLGPAVGTVTFHINTDRTVNVEYNIGENPLQITTARTYVGSELYPRNKQGLTTFAPEHYSRVNTVNAKTHTDTFYEVYGDVYIIAQADVDVVGPPMRCLPGTDGCDLLP